MDRCENFGEISLFGQGVSNAWHAQNLGAQIAIERNKRAHRDQRGSESTHRDPSHVGQRTHTVRRVGKEANHNPLNERIEDSAGQKGGEQREWSVAARILRFPHRRERGLESSVGKHQQQHGSQPLVGANDSWRVGRDSAGMRMQCE